MNINNSPWPYIIIMRETNACLCTLKTKKTSRTNVFCETFGHVFGGLPLGGKKKKQLACWGCLWPFFFVWSYFCISLRPTKIKEVKQHVCVCVCFVFLLKTSTAFFHHVSIQRVFVSCFQVTKKRACATGSTTLHFHALKIAGPGESSTSLYCFHALKTTMKTTKKYNTTYDIRFMIRIFCCQTSGHWEAKVGTDIERYHDFGSWTKARGGKDWKDCCWEGSRTGKGGMLDLLLNDLIWQAYFSHGWFNHQLGNPSTLNPYSRQKRRDL